MISRRFMAALLLGATVMAPATGAEEAAVEPAPPQIALDDLLGLPSNYQAEAQQRAGATQVEWRERFEQAIRAPLQR